MTNVPLRKAHFSPCDTLKKPFHVQRMKVVWQAESDQFNAAMLWADSCMCFFGFLRAGEVVVPSDTAYDSSLHLSVGDVLVDNVLAPRYLEVRVNASKTDLFRRGVSVYLGVTGNELCPVAAVLDYRVRRGAKKGPIFLFSDGKYLTRDRFVTKLRDALRAAGVDAAKYAGHSFRIGVATTAALCGVQHSLTLGR